MVGGALLGANIAPPQLIDARHNTIVAQIRMGLQEPAQVQLKLLIATGPMVRWGLLGGIVGLEKFIELPIHFGCRMLSMKACSSGKCVLKNFSSSSSLIQWLADVQL